MFTGSVKNTAWGAEKNTGVNYRNTTYTGGLSFMKIAATMVSMDAARTYTEVDQYNTGWNRADISPVSFTQTSLSPSGATFQQRFTTLLHSSTGSSQSGTCLVKSGEDAAGSGEVPLSSASDNGRSQALSSMVRHISGTSVTVNQIETAGRYSSADGGALSISRAGFSATAVHIEQESACFQANGTVQTECGRAISFSLGVQMQRQEVTLQSAGFARIVHGIDPIVLNFEDTISLCDETCFSFDLDGDGSCEELSGLGSGCGFLALDRDGDGSITSGLELFGPSTGSGFGELAELDSDGNSWIDENDPIFDQLKVWFAAGGEEERLLSLREAGVGAVSVAGIGTNFTLKDREGQVQGIVRADGLFLMENGEPRSLQEVDLVPKGEQGNEQVLDVADLDTDSLQDLDRLRDVIFWQRFRLQMMLAKKQLDNPADEMMERLRHLSADLKGKLFS